MGARAGEKDHAGRHLGWLWRLAVVFLAAWVWSLPARAAADDPPGRAARLQLMQGSVSFQPAGESDWVAAALNRPITLGDQLWADAGSRAELSIGSAVIRLGESTAFSFLNLDDHTVQLQLAQGRMDLHVRRLRPGETFEVDTPNEALQVLRPGDYRVEVDASGQSTRVTVRRGEGEAVAEGQSFAIAEGKSLTLSGSPPNPVLEEAVAVDDLEAWGRDRDVQFAQARSARYVSPDVVGYEDLDAHGTWQSDPQYGELWRPSNVPPDWAPYREGRWDWISEWGWTWVDDEPWGYAPFHYGRWVNAGGWAWVPGPVHAAAVFAPAQVAFVGGIGGLGVSIGAEVGWFPLGPGDVYMPPYEASPDYLRQVNVTNTTVDNSQITTVYNQFATNNTTNITYVNKEVPGAVTATPPASFAGVRPEQRRALDPHQVAAAPVVARAAVVPTQASVLGRMARAGAVPRPPARVMERPVVARTPPPAAPAPLAAQLPALAAHPGQPLAPKEAANLHAAPSAKRPPAKQVVPAIPKAGEQTTPGRPAATQPGAPPQRAAPLQPGAPSQPTTRPPARAPTAPPAPGAVGAPSTPTKPGTHEPTTLPGAPAPTVQPAPPPQPPGAPPPPRPAPKEQPTPTPPSGTAEPATPRPPSTPPPVVTKPGEQPAPTPPSKPAAPEPKKPPAAPAPRAQPTPPAPEKPPAAPAPKEPPASPKPTKPPAEQPAAKPRSTPADPASPKPPSTPRPTPPPAAPAPKEKPAPKPPSKPAPAAPSKPPSNPPPAAPPARAQPAPKPPSPPAKPQASPKPPPAAPPPAAPPSGRPAG